MLHIKAAVFGEILLLEDVNALQRAVGYSGNLECLASVFQVCQTLKRYGKVMDFTVICHCVGRTSTFFVSVELQISGSGPEIAKIFVVFWV